MRKPRTAAPGSKRGAPQDGLIRFGPGERLLHWAMTLPYSVLGATGAALLLGDALETSRSARQALVAAHVSAGGALILLPAAVLVSHGYRPFLGLFREAWRWRPADIAGLVRSLLRLVFPCVGLPPAGRFNAGQRLNLLHVFSLLPLVAATGIACWFVPAALLLRALHAFGALASLALAAGHMYLALIHPTTRAALGSMFHGRVPLAYAERHHPAWFEEATGRRAAEPPPSRRRISRLALAALAIIIAPCLVLCLPPARRRAREALASALGPLLEEPLQVISPAPLAALHATDRQLVRCTGCHDLHGVVASERCLACHETIGRRIAERKGYHGRLQGECASCHADHRPRLIALDDASFNHDQAGFRLRGKHADAACDSCHRRGGLERRRYVGIEMGCASCHEDPHGRPDAACSRCHEDDGRWTATGFDHNAMTRFLLDGIHRGLDCGACHGAGEKRRFRFGPPGDAEAADAFSCSGCHRAIASALGGNIAERKVVRSPHEGAVSCAECHEPASASSPKPCSACHPPDYDLLAVEWYARLEIERLRLHAIGEAPEPGALREIRAHNWEGAAQWLRGAGSGSSR